MATRLPSGKYRTLVQIGHWKDRKYKSFIGKTAREADMKAEAWKLSHLPNMKKGSLASAASDFFDAMTGILSPSTLRSYKSIYDNLPAQLKGTPLAEIESADLYTAYKRLKTPKTVRNTHGFISSLFTFRSVPMPPVTLPERHKTNYYIPDAKEVKSLLALSKGTKLEVPIALGVRGMRRGEVCAVEASDLDGNVLHIRKAMVYGRKGLVVKQPKTYASDRYIELPQAIADKIRKEGRATTYTPDSLTCAFKKFLKRNGFQVFRFHDLRHAFVSIAHSNGIPDSYIMSMGGWSTPYTMQNVYRHSLDSSLEKYSKKMEKILR